MNNTVEILNLLENSGLKNVKLVGGFIEFDDPSCIYAAFDSILNYGWIVILILTAIMLFGWGILYIKNGVNINTVFNNAKTLILVLCILSLVKPIINVIYGDNLFAKACERRQVSLVSIQKLLDLRKQVLSNKSEDSLYEIFDVVDSGQPVSINNYDQSR